MLLEDKIREIVDLVSNNLNDKELKKIFNENTFLTGGCFRSLYREEEVNDYDFYFTNEKARDSFISLITIPDIYNFVGMPYHHKRPSNLYINMMTKQACTLRVYNPKVEAYITVQFITKYIGSPQEVTKNFDFEHTKNFYYMKDNFFSLDFTYLNTKKLCFNENASHPLNALKRLQKFIKKGYEIDDKNLFKIGQAINRLNLEDPKVVEEQKTGMYL